MAIDQVRIAQLVARSEHLKLRASALLLELQAARDQQRRVAESAVAVVSRSATT
jgi:hypothetical protein